MMVRWLFLFLLAANLAVFLWQGLSSKPPVADPAPLPEGVPRIELAALPADASPADRLSALVSHVAPEGRAAREPGLRDADPAPRSAAAARARLGEGPACQRFGPFQAQADAAQLLWELSEEGLDATVQVAQDRLASGYWVVVKPDKAAIKTTMQKLQVAGFKDVWQFGKGEFANSLSLGLFSDQEAAEARIAELRNKGFTAQMERRVLDDSSFWLQVKFPAGYSGARQVLNRVYETYPRLAYPPPSCTKIAGP